MTLSATATSEKFASNLSKLKDVFGGLICREKIILKSMEK